MNKGYEPERNIMELGRQIKGNTFTELTVLKIIIKEWMNIICSFQNYHMSSSIILYSSFCSFFTL